MAEYITKAEALHAVEDAVELFRSEYDEVAEKINNVPAADVAPVKHGQWEWFDEDTGTPITGHKREWGWRCSRCKHELPDDYDDPDYRPMLDYCPYCGAKMKEGKIDA